MHKNPGAWFEGRFDIGVSEWNQADHVADRHAAEDLGIPLPSLRIYDKPCAIPADLPPLHRALVAAPPASPHGGWYVDPSDDEFWDRWGGRYKDMPLAAAMWRLPHLLLVEEEALAERDNVSCFEAW